MSDSAGLLIEEISEEYKLSDNEHTAIANLIILMYDDGGFSIEAIEHYITSIIKAFQNEGNNR